MPTHGTLTDLLHATPHPAWLIDRQGAVLLATPAAIELYGALAHVSDRNPGFQLADHAKLFDRVQAEGRATFVARLIRHGRIIEVPVEARPSGSREAMIAWFIPQTVTDALIETERLASMGTLAAGIGHEVKQPLTYLLGNLAVAAGDARLLQERAGAGEIPDLVEQLTELRAALADARHGGERIRGVIQDLLNFSRSDEGTLEPVNLAEVLETATTMAAPQFRHHARLKKAVAPVPAVLGNHTHLAQVFTNLLVNAAHATKETEDAVITIRARRAGQHVLVDIQDNGTGIPDDERERVFEPFVTTKKRGEGTGLGLAICRRIVVRLSGTIGVVPDPNGNTILRVQLPMHDRNAFLDVEPTPLPEAQDIRMTLLVIDDEPLVLATMRRAFSRMAEVISVESVNSALEVLQRTHIDAVLCDVMMPGLNGQDFYEILRERHPRLLKSTIFMTGGSPDEPHQKALVDAGFTLLEKPFDLGVLRTLLKELNAD